MCLLWECCYDKIDERGEGREHSVGVKKYTFIVLGGMVWHGPVRERDDGYGNVGCVCLL
jgi:hypothetical protein